MNEEAEELAEHIRQYAHETADEHAKERATEEAQEAARLANEEAYAEVYAEAYKEEYEGAFIDAYGAHREELLKLRAPQIEKTRERLAQIARRGAARLAGNKSAMSRAMWWTACTTATTQACVSSGQNTTAPEASFRGRGCEIIATIAGASLPAI